MNDQEYAYLKRTIRVLTGIDLECYKSQQMRRRLTFLITSQRSSVTAYCKLIGRDQAALQKLKNFLTINVSEFFRDANQFQLLKNNILPDLLNLRPRLSVWSAGCSHGAEPYSLAIILEELTRGARHRILATDIDEGILAKAKTGGPYTNTDIANVERRYLLKYFEKSQNGYRVTDHIQRSVEFKVHNLLSDSFARSFDLIVCRNVVIYFSNEAKSKLYKRFAESLNPNGVLFMGGTETLVDVAGLELEKLYNCFYRKSVSKPKVLVHPEPARV